MFNAVSNPVPKPQPNRNPDPDPNLTLRLSQVMMDYTVLENSEIEEA